YVQGEIDSLLAEIDSLNDRKLQLAPGASEEWSEIEEQIDRLTQRYDALLEYQKLFAAVDAQISQTASHMEMMNFVGQQFNLTASETEELAEALADEMNSLASGMFDAIEAQSALTESLFGLHEALAENGDEWSVYTQEGIANMEALQRAVEAAAANAAGDSAQFAANLATIFAQLESVGAGTSAELDFLRAQLVDTFNQTRGLSRDISGGVGSASASRGPGAGAACSVWRPARLYRRAPRGSGGRSHDARPRSGGGGPCPAVPAAPGLRGGLASTSTPSRVCVTPFVSITSR